RGVYFDALGGLFAAELLVPPDGFAALELGLRLADVGGELGFLLRQVRLELGKGRLAGLDLVGAQVDVGIQACLALVDLALALVESGRARSRLADDSRLVGVLAFERFELTPQPLLLEQQLSLALAQGLVLGRDARALLLEVGLAGHELPLALGDFLVAGPA